VHTPILGEPLNKTPLFAEMQIENTIKIGQPLILKFTVYNPAVSTQQFCKWHTPFEPLMSKYLEIKDENGVEMMYRGAMAKRIMPPPESSYIKVSKNDSISATVDLLKAFEITNPSTYTITYTGQDMSGVIVKKSTVFTYTR
jgi:hypothetical protein